MSTPILTLVHRFQTDNYGIRVNLSDTDYEDLFDRSADDIQLGTPIELFGATLRYTGSNYEDRGEVRGSPAAHKAPPVKRTLNPCYCDSAYHPKGC